MQKTTCIIVFPRILEGVWVKEDLLGYVEKLKYLDHNVTYHIFLSRPWGFVFSPVSVIFLVFSPSVDRSWFSFPIPACLSLSFAVILLDRLVLPCQYARKRSALNSSVSSEGRSLLLLPPSLNLFLPKPKSGQPNPHSHSL
jgi:hypothetical protein